ncbi:MAG: SDR family NAD(P)-dependent oxidoreductase, partial [Gammaproteobacteria bacterium]|nr:SDR family NAD(P)-dependent oxidoreductase [Gammaproteobacteria bacterium]
TGVLHRDDAVQPEKTMQALSASAMSEVFAVNAIGPALLAKHFLPVMRRKGKTVFAVLSARVGSIADNRLGGWVTYRASKAALNMVIKTLSIEQTRRRPESIMVALHPGTVDTALSKPFSSGVAEHALFTPEYSAACLLKVIDGLDVSDSGAFLAWDGTRIEY